MKDKRIGFYGYLVIAVLSLVAVIIYSINAANPYYEDFNAGVLVLMLASIALSASVAFLNLDNKLVKYASDFARVAIAVFVIWAAAIFIGARVESFGYIFGSNLELGNDAAFAAGTQAITGIVFFVLSWIVSLVALFLPVG